MREGGGREGGEGGRGKGVAAGGVVERRSEVKFGNIYWPEKEGGEKKGTIFFNSTSYYYTLKIYDSE